MKISLVQMNSRSDKAHNISMAHELMGQAASSDDPDLLVLPENFDFAGGTVADKLAAGESFPNGPAYSMCKEFARQHGLYVHAGTIQERPAGQDRNRNTSVVFDRDGKEVARYSKIHMFDIVAPDGVSYTESDINQPGNEVVTYALDGTTVGAAICYDLRFPELFTKLVKAGAEIIILPSAFTLQTGKDHWEVLCRARAIETQTWFVACDQFGTFIGGDGSTRHAYGHSLVADPWGHITAKASDKVGVLTAEIDLELVKEIRGRMPVSSHRTFQVELG